MKKILEKTSRQIFTKNKLEKILQKIHPEKSYRKKKCLKNFNRFFVKNIERKFYEPILIKKDSEKNFQASFRKKECQKKI